MSNTDTSVPATRQSDAIAPFHQETQAIPPLGDEIYFDMDRFNQVQKLAEIMASGQSTIPKHLAGNQGDCFAVISQAFRWRMDPFAVAQKTHIVNGALGYEAQLVVAAINSSGLLKNRLHYDFTGEGTALEVTVSGTLKGEDQARVKTLKLSQVTTKNSPLWKSDPAQQLSYLAAKYWARLYCPDVILGVYSPDEFQEETNGNHYGAEKAKVINASSKMDALESAVGVDADGVIVENTSDDTPPIISVPTGDNGPDWQRYADDFIKAAQEAPTPEAIKALAAKNEISKNNCFKQNKAAFKRIYDVMKDLGAAQ